MKKEELQGVPKQPTDKMRAFFPRTNEGVSVDTVRHNLNILVHIHKSEPGEDQRAQTFLPTLVWFEVAGFVNKDIQEMLVDPKEQACWRENDRVMKGVYSKPEFASTLVYRPLPVYTDTRFVSDRDRIELFSFSKEESTTTTASWLHMLLLR